MNTLKVIGQFALAFVIIVGLVAGAIIVFSFGVTASVVVAPWIYSLAGYLLVLNIIALFFAVAPSLRIHVGNILYLSSYVYGLSTWIFGLIVTLSLWGLIALLIGLFLGGIGVVPIGMLAAVFNGRWDLFWSLIGLTVLTYSTRFISVLLIENANNDGEYIEADTGNKDKDNRSWKDIE